MIKGGEHKEGKIYLSRKEKLMLKFLLKDGKISNTNLSKKLKISSQVTGRIKQKLERQGMIRGYPIELNPTFLGIHTFALILFKSNNSHYENLFSKNLICLYKVLADSITHIALYGFRDLGELNNQINSLIKHSNDIKIGAIHILPVEGIIKRSSRNVFYDALSGFKRCQITNHSSKPNERKIKIKYLTFPEKQVLRALVENSNFSCKRISLNTNLSYKSVNRIKKRLEAGEIIKSYNLDLDYVKLGLNFLSFIFLNVKSSFIENKKELLKTCSKSHQVISCFGTNGKHILLCCFRDMAELNNYCDKILRTQYKEFVEIEDVYLVSTKDIIKESFTDLYLSLLE